MKKNVARFDISMHYIGFGQKLESFEEIIEIVHRLLLTKSALVLDLLLKSTSITVLINKVIIVCCFENLDKSDDMGSILDFRKSLYFVDSELLKFRTGFKFLNFDDLDSYSLVCFLVDCSIHFSELTLPYHII